MLRDLSLSQKEEDAVKLFTPPEWRLFLSSAVYYSFAGEIGNVINQKLNNPHCRALALALNNKKKSYSERSEIGVSH